MSPDDVQALNDQIAAMARAGLPLDQGLESLAGDMGGGKLRRVTKALAADLKAGATLSEALAKRKRGMPEYYAPLVAAGIRTGQLPLVLATLGQYSKSIGALRSTVVDALLYPILVLAFGSGLIGFLTFYILPQFDRIFSDFGLSLPWLTKTVLEVSRVPLPNALSVFAAVIVTAFLLWLATRISSNARRHAALATYHLPLMGTVIRAARLTAFAELLAILVKYEVPMPEAFRTAGLACPDPVMAHKAAHVAANLEAGQTLADSLSGHGLVPQWMAWMTDFGERQGNLAEALHQVGLVYRAQVESRIAVLRNVLPSFIIIAVAILVLGGFVAVVLLPISKLMGGLLL